MALREPHLDLPPDADVASDVWDDGSVAGALLLAEFFGVQSSGITGALAAQETGSDTLIASGAVRVAGALVVQEAGPDVLAATGQVRVSGSLVAQEAGPGPVRRDRHAAVGRPCDGLHGRA